MAAIALLKFEQSSPSAIVGDGKALVVVPGNPVAIKNLSLIHISEPTRPY